MKFFALVASVAPIGFMSDTCETVAVTIDGNSVIINKSDYDADPDAYTLRKADTKAIEPPVQAGVTTSLAPGLVVPPAPSAPDFGNGAPAPVLPVPPVVPSPNQKFVKKDGKKFYVVIADGSKVEGVEGIDATGYATEADAWAAVNALPH